MRLILFLFTLFLFYYLLKRLVAFFQEVQGHREETRTREQRGESPALDELVKDPVCGVYVAKRDAFTLRVKGENYFFCSEECRGKFKKTRE